MTDQERIAQIEQRLAGTPAYGPMKGWTAVQLRFLLDKLKAAAALLALALVAADATAQTNAIDGLFGRAPTAAERKAADVASWATVGAAFALDAKATIGKCDGSDTCHRAIVLAAARVGATVGAVELIKRLSRRARPDGSDALSFPSGHTAFAFSTVGGPRLAFALPLAIGTGGLRVAAGRHWLTDTIAGAGVGLLAGRIR